MTRRTIERGRSRYRHDVTERQGRATPDELEAAFELHRRELHVHCYRMTGSYWDAEDLLQETYLRAWRNLARFERRSSLRTWLYTIATNASIDLLKRRDRGGRPARNVDDIVEHDEHLQPYPDPRHAVDDPADVAVSQGRRRALLRRRAHGAAAAATRGADRPRRARLAGDRVRRADRCLGRGNEQPAATSTVDDA